MTYFARKYLTAALGLFAAQAAHTGMAQDAFMMEGTIVTMDAKNRVAQAVGVDENGLIVEVGSVKQVTNAMQKRKRPYHVKPLLQGGALLPGFIDPHMHVVAVATQKSGQVGLLHPCLPEPYNGKDKNCYYTIEDALIKFGQDFYKPNTKMLGQNLDPSRQPYNEELNAAAFKAAPAYYISKTINEPYKDKDVPVVIFDQSGHFGYVNEAAFRALPKGTLPPKFEKGEWPLKPRLPGQTAPIDLADPASYTGLLVEPDSFEPFIAMMVPVTITPEAKSVALNGMKVALDSWRTAGVTTVVSMVASEGEYQVAKAMTTLCSSNTRIGLIVTPDMAKEQFKDGPEQVICASIGAGCAFPKYLGATGVKTILDGSTQGCTAAVQKPSNYTRRSGCMEGATILSPLHNYGGRGRLNLDQKMLTDQLGDLWKQGKWRFESHANGNRAMRTALATYDALNRADDAIQNRVVIIHATIGDDDATSDTENVWAYAGALIKGVVGGKKQAPMKLAFTHTIGHVPYWGGRFEQVLGYHAAQNAVPFGWDKKYGIPYSMNSDAMVTASLPLSFVQQAVTRETWTYPNLEAKYSHVLGAQHKLTVTEALRAVTINPAREKGLDNMIGSIEKGKVADFVLLGDNPLTYAAGDKSKLASDISKIKVQDTYLGGKSTTGTCP